MMRHCIALALVTAALTGIASRSFAVDTITIESRCSSGPAYVEGGTGWNNSSSKSNRTPCTAGSRYNRTTGAWADFIPTIVTEGYYDVYLTWGGTTASNNGPNAENVQVSIIDNTGAHSYAVNMRGHAGCAGVNNDQLIYVGRGYFRSGQGHKVRVTNTATAQCYNGASKRSVIADATIFQYYSPLPVEPSTWGHVKALYRD